MIVIPRTKDKIPVKIGELEFLISPLNVEQKLKLAGMVKMDKGEEKPDSIGIALSTIKFGVKGLKGAVNLDGSEYKLEFDASGVLTDDCVSDISNIPGNDKLVQSCIAIGNGQLDVKLDGVEIVLPKKEEQSEKK